jgi:hypothetical protein
MNANKNFTILLVVAVVLAVSSLVVFKLVSKERDNNMTAVQESSDTANEQLPVDEIVSEGITVEMRSSLSVWQKNTVNEIEILFASMPTPPPNALTLQVLYDPSVVRIDDINPGNLWGEVNVLQKSIDNTKGEVVVSMGQGFDSQFTGELSLLTLNALLLNDTDADVVISLGPESASASTGIGELIPVSANDIIIRTN